jgi:hypothetical protein
VKDIKEELLRSPKKCKYFEIQSDKNNLSGEPLKGVTRKDDPKSPVIDYFMFKKRRFYLVER